MPKRFAENPILTTKDIKPSQEGFVVECVLNPGVFWFEEKIWLLLRVAERPIQKEGFISLPVMSHEQLAMSLEPTNRVAVPKLKILEFKKDDPLLDLTDARIVRYKNKVFLSTLSHLRLVCSDDNGLHFYEPNNRPTKIFGNGVLETYGIEDCRVSLMNDIFNLTYTQVSENGVGVGLMQTYDWKTFDRIGMILPPHNKDCALFEEKIGDKYFCFHRPSGIDLGGNFIWIASSFDLIHWGNHHCIIQTRENFWDSARVGAGAAPIKTEQGWLAIYHGADKSNCYALGAILLDLENPSIVIARSNEPLMKPTEPYERTGFFGNVVFTNGHIVKDDEITMYYGASDDCICGATLSIKEILKSLIISR